MNSRDILWAVSLLTFGIGDLLTTTIGFEVGLVESHPGFPGLEADPQALLIILAGKVIVFMFTLAAYRYLPEPMRVGIPVGLSILGAGVVAWNSYLILSVMG